MSSPRWKAGYKVRWTQDEPSYGSIVRTQVKFYYHYGIFVDEQTVIQFGLPDNGETPAEEIKVMITDIDVFANGNLVETGICDTAEERSTCRKPDEIVSIARSHIGETGYHILHNNCEHFVYGCVFGKKKSFLDDVRETIRRKLKETE